MMKWKRLTCLVLLMALMLSMVPSFATSAYAAPAYDPVKALNYAKSHWNDGQGLCAEFVSRCVIAGGLKIGVEAGTGGCWRAITKATGLSKQTLKLNSKGYATKELNEGILAAGDVVIQWCNTHSIAPHIMICGGFDSSGYATYYAHNGALNNQRYKLSVNLAYQHTTDCDMGGQVIHLSSLSNVEVPGPVVTNCRYRVTVPANYKLQCYKTAESTENYRFIAAQTSEYSLTCTQKIDLPNGTTRYFFVSGDGYNLYFNYSNQMSVKALHNYTTNVISATCTEQGYTHRTCTCGLDEKVFYTGVLGHDMKLVSTTGASCTGNGQKLYQCTRCQEFSTEVIPSAGHTEVTDQGFAATCTTNGKTEGKHCSVCGAVTVAQKVINATGHSYVNGKCSVCGAADPYYGASSANPVTRVFGSDRYATAFKAADTLKSELGISKFQNIVVASGTGFADALAGSYLAAQKNAPILLVRGANVNDVKNYIKNNLASGGTVYLLGGVNAVPKAMESGLEGFYVKRLGGADRYATNLLILKEAGVGNKDLIVCTGKNFADSLSASATGLPILLVKDGLTDGQKAFLKTVFGRIIVVGGTNAVNTTVATQLTYYGNVKRLAGNTRYDTSVLVAKEFFSAPKSAVLAYAQNFPDGLSGGPLAYALKAPLILTDSNKSAAAVNYATGAGIKRGYALGGPGLISDKVVKNIFSMKAADVIAVK